MKLEGLALVRIMALGLSASVAWIAWNFHTLILVQNEGSQKNWRVWSRVVWVHRPWAPVVLSCFAKHSSFIILVMWWFTCMLMNRSICLTKYILINCPQFHFAFKKQRPSATLFTILGHSDFFDTLSAVKFWISVNRSHFIEVLFPLVEI